MRLPEKVGEAVNLGRCFVELGQLALHELAYNMDEALDCYGEDSAEDAAVPSSINQWERAA